MDLFLTIPNVFCLLFLIGGGLLVHCQVLREEALKKLYGNEYLEYCKKVRRYF
ncbi:hypothetical protein [endosymbiont 'TC1' of Trimyema compressum]|uniref:hypothetical protein n=1 Tax=endosymbiont 'TC1' of Trimyema compressum TaxID=243899 RepID=UPI001FE10CBD|nr:hypothetical protein [endosymbiont 'TC1' of Trimyema compressum]